MKKLIELKSKSNIKFTFVSNIDDMKVIEFKKDWIKIFGFLNKYNYYFIPFSVRYKNIDSSYLFLVSLYKKYNNVDLVFWKYPYLLEEKKEFVSTRLWTKDCKYFTYMDFNGVDVFFNHEENEINIMLNWDLTMHTNICYLSKYRYICNVFDNNDQQKSDFEKFYENLKKVNTEKTLFKKCYKCIYWN